MVCSLMGILNRGLVLLDFNFIVRLYYDDVDGLLALLQLGRFCLIGLFTWWFCRCLFWRFNWCFFRWFYRWFDWFFRTNICKLFVQNQGFFDWLLNPTFVIALLLWRLPAGCLDWFLSLKSDWIRRQYFLSLLFFLDWFRQYFLLRRCLPRRSLSLYGDNLFLLFFNLKWFHIFLRICSLPFCQSQLLSIHFLLFLQLILDFLLASKVPTLIELATETLIRSAFSRVFLEGEEGVIMREGVLLQVGQSEAFSLDLCLDVLQLADGVRVCQVELAVEVGGHPLLGSSGG